MRRALIEPLRATLSLGVLLLAGGTAFGANPNTYQITPDQTTMVIGESRSFRMVDENGQAQHQVRWTLSDVDAFQETEGDELHLYARRAGEFRLTARTDFATAEGTVKVVEAKDMTQGTMKWQSGKKEGCTTIKILPARPNGNDVYVYQQTQCEDGVYLAAYTSDGVHLWRRKISDSPSQTGSDDYEVEGEHLEARPASICDAVTVGMEQEKIRAMLTEQHLTFREQPGAEHVWVVEQSNAQCRLQFDDKLMLAKKKKVIVVE
ncbi:MAG: hypothetical protein WA853_06390 [Candidatus Acidiferrum sp.]